MTNTIFEFIGGNEGQWKVISSKAVTGENLAAVSHLKIIPSSLEKSTEYGAWALKGFRSNIRYTDKTEKEKLNSIQSGLDRPEATCAALIPIRKTAAWWELAQDERRKIFEEQSHHTQTGLKYLPAIARRLYHCRDIGESFDFLTWFEYAPEHAAAFEELLVSLRKTTEWTYVDWEVDIRLRK
ncbi:MAG: chlorite dismutase family protein [Chitinophagaceae bacterium]